ncbi:hypothetical protein PoB_005330300 [Plakobranchus ocellatus]|uniref:Uncharacterized protein n=1 Tax=Plakobranchus ocellatus TaxID=259542 RepID=A0AAV4C4I0_9GAST|nr:hypothetical protein PoB_005330300 [Plakobranchus ocellatus]
MNTNFNTKEIPEDMTKSILITLPKKPGTTECEQHRMARREKKIRIRKAEAAYEAPAQRRRALRKQAQQPAQQNAIRAEGGPFYVPGGF